MNNKLERKIEEEIKKEGAGDCFLKTECYLAIKDFKIVKVYVPLEPTKDDVSIRAKVLRLCLTEPVSP